MTCEVCLTPHYGVKANYQVQKKKSVKLHTLLASRQFLKIFSDLFFFSLIDGSEIVAGLAKWEKERTFSFKVPCCLTRSCDRLLAVSVADGDKGQTRCECCCFVVSK